MVQVGEAQRVTEEEHGRVVAHHVPVAFLGIELQCKTSDVAFSVRGAALAGNGREARHHRRLLADLGEDLRLRIAGDVVRDGEGAVRAGALGMHAALRDYLSVEMGQLFDQPEVPQQRRAARPGGENIQIIGNRGAGCVC